MAAVLCLLAGGLLRFVPTRTFLGPVARIFDSLSPWLLAGSVGLALLCIALGGRRSGAVLCLLAGLAAVQIVHEHRTLSLPLVPDAAPDLRVLFFNALNNNAAFGDRIVTAALALEPDVIVIAEGGAIRPALPMLRAAYDFVSPCEFGSCDLVVATKRRPGRFWQLSLNPIWKNRYAVADLTSRGGKRYFLAASHLAKPWFTGVSEGELARLSSQYDWLRGPVIAVGDFNAAPWSLPMRDLMKSSGMRMVRWPVPTWPAAAGRLGIPIDHVLVHEGARVVRIEAFGADLNSNHRGLVADIALP